MKALRVTSNVLIFLAISWIATGVDLAQNSSRKVEKKEQYSAVPQKEILKSNKHASLSASREVCLRVCTWWSCRTYYCEEGVCCRPGSPGKRCCPSDYPVCQPNGACCSRDSPNLCGDYCCSNEESCCDGKACCNDANSCCGDECCNDDAPCCQHEDSSTCCNVMYKACCDGYGCVDPCESPFEALGCHLGGLFFGEEEVEGRETEIAEGRETENEREGEREGERGSEREGERENNREGGKEGEREGSENGNRGERSEAERAEERSEGSREARAMGDKLYRIIRPDQNPQAIVAKDPSARKTVLSHVNCGGRDNYVSQFISTSATLETARRYKAKGEAKGLTGLRICEIDVNELRTKCWIFDLTVEEYRRNFLGRAIMATNFAIASEEVLLQCNAPISCTVVDPPPRPN